jgi:hypothetical protein
MFYRLSVSLAAACVVAGLTACGSGGPQNQPTSLTTPASTPAPFVTIGTFEGDWTGDGPVDVDGSPGAASAVAQGCTLVEFHVVRAAGGTATIVFAATCARVRFRAEGKGTLTGETLSWKAEGVVGLGNGDSCRFRFTEGNSATPAGDGRIKVTYNGTVCGIAVSGTELVRRR